MTGAGKLYDLLIVGAGPAGITAAVYAARQRLDFIVISKDVGGQTLLSFGIENYLGYHYVTGAELVKKFEEHMRDYDIVLKEEEVLKIEKAREGFSVETDENSYKGRTLIIASGKKARRLNVPGEGEFLGKGVSYCATCDGPLFSGKDVAVVGGGPAGLEVALALTKIANKIYLIDVTPEISGEPVIKEKVLHSKKIEILNNSETLEIKGETFVTGIVLKDEKRNEEKTLSVQGVFVEIGSIPNTDFLGGLVRLNDRKEIVIDKNTRTSVPGVFAAGDVTDIPEKQIIVAAGEGAKACLNAVKYLQESPD